MLLTGVAAAQVLSPMEVSDPAQRNLQQRYTGALQAAASGILAHKFPYPFYFSRVLDIDLEKQLQTDQRSIRFGRFEDQMVLEITGNYFVSYSAPAMDANARARCTFFDVMLPLLKATVPLFPADQDFQAFALEVSHHVRGKIAGIKTENAENIVLVLPRAAAKKLVNATGLEQQQAAVLEGRAYLDGEPMMLWLSEEPAPKDWNKRTRQHVKEKTEVASTVAPPVVPEPTVSPTLLKPSDMPVRLIAPDTLTKLQSAHERVVARMVKDLGPQAHFVTYAPPAFIAFHQGAYLQLATESILANPGNLSRYTAAALAFDDHISHLVRPVLAYFQQESSFDGVDFSTTVKSPGMPAPIAVEFLLPFSAMQCFAQYDCTGQQLVDSGIVLINGERAALSLEVAERIP